MDSNECPLRKQMRLNAEKKKKEQEERLRDAQRLAYSTKRGSKYKPKR
jgi:hypothetical protein